MITSRDRIKQEILKCARDPIYFITQYCKIQHPKRGLIPFDLWDFQKNCINDFRKNEYIVIVKARQLGLSTTIAAYVAWFMLFQKDRNVLVLATKIESAKNLVKKVKIIFADLPDWLKIAKEVTNNKQSFELSNRSIIKALSTAGDAGRSEAVSLLIVDEAAHVENMDTIWTSVSPTLSQGDKGKSIGARCIALSSPSGVGSWFHKTYIDAVAETNGFFPISLPWNAHPERDEEWLEREKKKYSPRDFAQEFFCSFNSSGATVVAPEDIEWLKTLAREPISKLWRDRNLWIWEEYNPDHAYFMTVDVASGHGKDYSALHICDVATSEIVAEYKGQLPTDEFSLLVNHLGLMYGKCLIVVEENSIGQTILMPLKGMEYPNLYWHEKGTNRHIEHLMAVTRDNCVPGFTMSSTSRPLVVNKLEEFIRNKQIFSYSSRFANELDTFVWKQSGKPEAQKNYNDDLIMSMAILCWIKEQVFALYSRDVTIRKKLLSCIYTTSTKFNTKLPGQRAIAPLIMTGDSYIKNEMNKGMFPFFFRG